mmetsp:Transcript_18856/g.53270  ORF Transcript_18856/g.53270 Transcript_18856/m.53270 type:complete len:195 (-) Transcript_18856:134-718(-)
MAAVLRAAALAAAVVATAAEPPRELADAVGLIQRWKSSAEQGSDSTANQTANASFFPLFLPIARSFIPIPITFEEFPPTPHFQEPPFSRPKLRASKFWQPKYDPDWQPGAITHHGVTKAPRARQVTKCEDIFDQAECSDSVSQHSFTCNGWGGLHCLPLQGAKCSDLVGAIYCSNSSTWGLTCAMDSKGCSPSR